MARQQLSRGGADASELSTARALRIVWRAARLRCPNCGSGGILDGWFKLKHRCPTCGLVLDRGESDYFLGAYTVNLVAVELLVTGVLVAVGMATAPDVPWTLLTWGGAALALVVAIGCYPLTKVLWLAFDIILRPVTVEEIEIGRQETGVAKPTRTDGRK
jgi:uncharacterized protein (DUF983 family)